MRTASQLANRNPKVLVVAINNPTICQSSTSNTYAFTASPIARAQLLYSTDSELCCTSPALTTATSKTILVKVSFSGSDKFPRNDVEYRSFPRLSTRWSIKLRERQNRYGENILQRPAARPVGLYRRLNAQPKTHVRRIGMHLKSKISVSKCADVAYCLFCSRTATLCFFDLKMLELFSRAAGTQLKGSQLDDHSCDRLGKQTNAPHDTRYKEPKKLDKSLGDSQEDGNIKA